MLRGEPEAPQEPRGRTGSLLLERVGWVPGKLTGRSCWRLAVQQRQGIRYLHVGAENSQLLRANQLRLEVRVNQQTGRQRKTASPEGGACAPSRHPPKA